MNYSKIGIRYAKALLLTSVEEGTVEKIKDDIQFIYNVITTVPEFNYIFNSPIVKPSEKNKIFNETFSSHLSKLTIKFIEMLINHHRENHLSDVIRNFIDLYKQHKGILSATLVSTIKLNEAETNKIAESLRKTYNKNVEIITSVNQNLIGGFILQIEDKQYDASIQTQLKLVKKKLTEIQL